MRDDPFYRQDEPTDPIRPPTPSQQNQQGEKLILGNFRDRQAQQRPERKAYQYPRQQNVDRPPVYPQRQAVPPGWSPAVNPNAPQYPYHQPGQVPGAGGPIPRRPRPRRRRMGCLITTLIVLLLVCIIGGFTLVTAQRVLAF